MTSAAEWTDRVGASWAQEWQRTDRSFGELTDRLVAEACRLPFTRAVDIGCGAGELSLRLAAASSARVNGIDVSADLIDVARARSGKAANLDFELADAARWRPSDGLAPDLLVSRHGVMFFGDPVAAFASLREASAPGARLVFSCFRKREENAWVTLLESALDDAPAPEPGAGNAPGPFAFGDRMHVAALLTSAGWTEVHFQAIDYAMIAGEGDDPVSDAAGYFQRIGPAAGRLAELDDGARSKAINRLRKMLEDHCRDGVVSLPSTDWLVTAHA